MVHLDSEIRLLEIKEVTGCCSPAVLEWALDRPCVGLSLVQGPTPGPYSLASSIEVSGWALGRSQEVSRILLVCDGAALKVILQNKLRPDVVHALGLSARHTCCGFKTKLALAALPRAFALEIHVEFQDESRLCFAKVLGAWATLEDETLGGHHSTLLNALLSLHTPKDTP